MNAENAKLRIQLLGPAVVLYGDQPVHVQRRVMRAILFYLACQTEPVGRSTLMDLLWPEEDEEQARRRLREVLSKLRAQLPSPSMIVAEQDYVHLDMEQVYVDVLEFQALVDQVHLYLQRQGNSPLPESIYQQMFKAINLWRRAEFVAGTNLPSSEGIDRWYVMTSQSLYYNRQAMLETLARHSAVSGDMDMAVFWVRRAIETDEDNPDLYYLLVNWLRNMGRRIEALKVCDQVRAKFHDLGEEVPSALVALCQQVHEEAAQPEMERQVPWHNQFTLQVPFVGRKEVLSQLRLALQRGGLELIWGEAGAGKSRLTFEFYQSLEPAPRLLFAAGHINQMDLPYQPLIDVLRHSVTITEWQQLDVVWANILTELVPELTSLRPGTTSPPRDTVPANRRQRISEALLQILHITARRQRLLFFLDDAQWCDPDTLGVLAYLLDNSLFNERGLLVIAARPEETNPDLKQFTKRSQMGWRIHHNQVDLFTREEIAELCRHVIGKPPRLALVDQLARDTGGNPLFLLEILHTLLDYNFDPDDPRHSDHLPLAFGILKVAEERFRLLDPQVSEALEVAAVIGNTFTPELFAAAAHLELDQAVVVLEELERIRLVKPSDQDDYPGPYTFIHEKIREVMLYEMSQVRRRFLNLRVAKAIEQTGQDTKPKAVLVAGYYEAGGDMHQAFRNWMVAADYARDRLDRAQATLAYRRAEIDFDAH